MPYESVNSDHEEKEEDLLNSNHIINLNNLITNMDNFLVCKELSKERALQINLEENLYVENFIDYVEGYFQLTPSDEQKGVKELHEDFKKQTYNLQKDSHQDSFCISIYKRINGLASTI